MLQIKDLSEAWEDRVSTKAQKYSPFWGLSFYRSDQIRLQTSSVVKLLAVAGGGSDQAYRLRFKAGSLIPKTKKERCQAVGPMSVRVIVAGGGDTGTSPTAQMVNFDILTRLRTTNLHTRWTIASRQYCAST